MRHVLNRLLPILLVFAIAGCAATPTRESTGQYVDDTAITAKVKAALLHADDVHSLNVSVETYKGVVQLSGFVNSEAEKARAEKIASGIEGVKRVEDRMSVKPAAD